MLKWFAKHQKLMLVGFGSLLMIVFLLPAGGDFLQPDPGAVVVGHVDGEKITAGDLAQAAGEMDLLKELSPTVDMTFRVLEVDKLGWVLLMREARQQGVYFPIGHARFNAQQFVESSPELAERLRANRAGVEHLAQALQHWTMFNQLQELTFAANRPSERRLAHYAVETRSLASVRVVGVRAADHLEGVADPTDAEVAAHFEKYKGEKAGEGEPYGFGYRTPHRVKIEYISVPLKRIANTIHVDDFAGQKYYQTHTSEFLPGPETTTPGDDDPDAGDEPETKPEAEPKPDDEAPSDGDAKPDAETSPPAPAAEPDPAPAPEPEQDPEDDEADASPQAPAVPAAETGPAKLEPLPYRQVRDRIIAKLTEQQARERRDRIVEFLQGELTTNARRLYKTDGGYYILSADKQPIAFDALQKAVQDNPQFGGVLLDYERIENDWLTLDDVAAMSGIGSASVTVGGQAVPIERYIASARELDPAGADPLRVLSLQAGIHSRPVIDDAGNAYVFRIIEASPDREPALDEPGVREQVVKDLKTLTAYKSLVERRKDLASEARAAGLSKFAEDHAAKVETISGFRGREGRDVPELPLIGRSEQFVDAVFEIARRVHEEGGVDKAPAAFAVDAIPVDAKLMVAVTQLIQYLPVDTMTFRAQKAILDQELRRYDMFALADKPELNPLSPKALRKRLGYVPATGYEDEHDAATGEKKD